MVAGPATDSNAGAVTGNHSPPLERRSQEAISCLLGAAPWLCTLRHSGRIGREAGNGEKDRKRQNRGADIDI